MNNDFDKKLKTLNSLIDKYTDKDIVVAFSGGVDSSLVLKLVCEKAKEKNTKVYAITMHTKLHPMKEIEISKSVAKEVGAIHIIIEVDEFKDAGIEDNPKDRCYLCKKHLFNLIMDKAKELNAFYILEGTNEDDLHVYRPGLKALKELGIISPLALAGMTKEEVRKLAAINNISTSDKPSSPCMATRFPYGTKLTVEAMKKVEEAEEYLKTFGLYNVRVRVHGNFARIEVDEKDFLKVIENKKRITDFLKSLGYSYVNLDLEGFRSGSMDIDI